MKKTIKTLFGLVLAGVLAIAAPATTSYAGSEILDCFDFENTTMAIPAGGAQKMWLRATYDYTYFIEGATSDGTYLETDFKSGSKDVVFHVGDDEQGGNVFFHFYVRDERLQTEDKHDCIEIYVQNRQTTIPSLQVPIAGGKVGTLSQNGRVSMLYNDKGVAMASFSLTLGNGHMASYGQKSVENNGANYFSLVSASKGATPVISESDKAVMLANGYAGVVVNGKFINWP